MADDVLEGRKLERVLGWALLFTVIIIAVAVPDLLPVRADPTGDGQRHVLEAVDRPGGTLFANNQSPYYDATTSLLCANCHGVHGEGGSTAFTLQPEADLSPDQGEPEQPERPAVPPPAGGLAGTGAQHRALTASTRRSADRHHHVRETGDADAGAGGGERQGVLGPSGGSSDLVNYIQSIQIPLKQAQQQATAAIGQYKQQAQQPS